MAMVVGPLMRVDKPKQKNGHGVAKILPNLGRRKALIFLAAGLSSPVEKKIVTCIGKAIKNLDEF